MKHFWQYAKWRSKYNSGLLGYKTYNKGRVIVIASHEVARDLLKKQGDRFMDRPQDKWGQIDSGGNFGWNLELGIQNYVILE